MMRLGAVAIETGRGADPQRQRLAVIGGVVNFGLHAVALPAVDFGQFVGMGQFVNIGMAGGAEIIRMRGRREFVRVKAVVAGQAIFVFDVFSGRRAVRNKNAGNKKQKKKRGFLS